MNAQVRIVHPKPASSTMLRTTRGKTTPPAPPPLNAIPIAAARRFSNHVMVEDTAGYSMKAVPTPEHSP
jgi:hypothetical protein